MEGERDHVMTVLKDYVKKVVPKIYRSWLKFGAHTVAYGYPEQCLFWHTVNASVLEKYPGALPAKLKQALFLRFCGKYGSSGPNHESHRLDAGTGVEARLVNRGAA